MLTEVIIPIKNLSNAKQRLAGILTPELRSGLVLAMLEDLLGKLAEVNNTRIWVIASNRRVSSLAESVGAHYIDEGENQGYNSAITFALHYIAQHIRCSVFPAAVVPGDLPLANTDELSCLITPIVNAPCIGLAPDRLQKGTNGLYLSRWDLIPPAFGNNSFNRHRNLAQPKGIKINTINAAGLAQDIDTPDDLAKLAAVLQQGASYEFLQKIDPACLFVNEHHEQGAA